MVEEKNKKILIVEDDKFLRELISQKLVKENFDIAEAVDGEQAVKKVKDVNPDLILLDLILPGIDGFEVLTKIKEDPVLAEVPVIILSNLGQKDDIEKGLNLGATDYLIKAHFTPSEIIEKVKKNLKQ
jgi:DNA-binding response OmpR family regulator